MSYLASFVCAKVNGCGHVVLCDVFDFRLILYFFRTLMNFCDRPKTCVQTNRVHRKQCRKLDSNMNSVASASFKVCTCSIWYVVCCLQIRWHLMLFSSFCLRAIKPVGQIVVWETYVLPKINFELKKCVGYRVWRKWEPKLLPYAIFIIDYCFVSMWANVDLW